MEAIVGSGAALADLDLTDPDFWLGDPAWIDETFAELRATDPCRRFDEPARGALGRGRGFVALTRHADISFASRRIDLFASGNVTDVGPVAPLDVAFHGGRLLPGDPRHHQAARILSRARGRPADGADSGPVHAQFRRVVSGALTPNRVAGLGAHIDRLAREIVDGIAEQGSADFVVDVASRLPLRVLLDLLGLPRSHEDYVFERTNTTLGLSDPAYATDQTDGGVVSMALQAGSDLADLVDDVCDHRRRLPADDVISALVHAEVGGEPLAQATVRSYLIIMLTAGNETTRNAISHGVLALAAHPDQRAIWAADVERVTPTAVEEVLRWGTPVSHFRRTCTTDGVRVGDVELAAGDHVVLWYRSANRDGAVFDHAAGFDVRRDPNAQVSFGAPGAHICLGAHLARREIAAMMGELVRRLPDLAPTAPPVRLRSTFLNGIRHLPVAFTPVARSSASL